MAKKKQKIGLHKPTTRRRAKRISNHTWSMKRILSRRRSLKNMEMTLIFWQPLRSLRRI